MLALVIGDLNVPHGASDIPAKFKSLFIPGRIQHILCTGNLCNEASYEYLKSVCGSMTMVQGDLDDGIRAPDSAVVKLGDLKIGLCHGHQLIVPGDREAVAALQRRMGVDVLLTGHTHSVQVYKTDDGFVINPGSATGAPCPASLSPTPSFVLMDIDGSKAAVYVYELVEGEVKVDKVDFVKPSAAAQSVAA